MQTHSPMRSANDHRPPSGRRWPAQVFRSIAIVCGMLWAATATTAADADRHAGEAQKWGVISGYLANFAREVTWPGGSFAADDQLFRIGLLAPVEVDDVIESFLKDKAIGNRRIEVIRDPDASALEACQIIFVADYKAAKQVAEEFAGKPKLIVTFSPGGFEKTGSSIELIHKGENIRWILNAGALKAQGITPSNALNKLALEVRKGPTPEAPKPSKEDAP